MNIDETGSDPKHLIRAVKKYRMKYQEFQPMTIEQVVACLDRGRPVMIMLQAWRDGSSDRRSYRGHWKDGHWIVAIGYDTAGIYFEDPAIYRTRGFLRRSELDLRWHDVVGKKETRVDHYGIAIWKPGVHRSVFPERARCIQ